MDHASFIPYARPCLSEEDCAAVADALSSPWITRGPRVEAFEREIASYTGAKYAVAFNSATTALAAACYAAEVNCADRLITTPNSFIASVGAGIKFGASPVFVDIDEKTGNIDLDQMICNANLPLSRGRPILIPVHFAGVPVNIQKLDRKTHHPNQVIIEDAAHALGSLYFPEGPRVGCCQWSAMTIFSFHPAKTITTGEGGMVTTNEASYAHRLRLYRNNGIERNESSLWHYDVVDITGNYHLTEFQAVLGISQLRRLDQFISKRQALMRAYRENLQGCEGVSLLTPQFDSTPAFHLCVVKIDFSAFRTTREEVMKKLLEKKIGTQLHYIPLYRHPYFVKQFGEVEAYFPQMEKYYQEALSLPLHCALNEEHITAIVASLKQCLHA